MTAPNTPLVHTPYNCTCDMVPYETEGACRFCNFLSAGNSSCGASLTDGATDDVIVQHEYLSGQCEYLEHPHDGRIEQAPKSSRLFKLFVGHVKFEITPPELRWIIYMLTGVTCGKIEPRGLGCFMVFFQDYDEMWKVKGLHKRTLFDHNGVWFARNKLQEEILQHYASTYLRNVDHSRLPKGLMVVDEETSRKRKHSKPQPNAFSAPMLAPGYVPAPIMHTPIPLPWTIQVTNHQ